MVCDQAKGQAVVKEKSSQIARYVNLFRHVENPGRHIGAKLGLVRDDPVEFVLKGGLKLRVPRKRLVEFKMVVMDDCYLKGFKRGALFGPGPMTIVDVGANLGFFSLYAKSVFPQATVVCVEPMQVNYDFLLRNIRMNERIEDSITCVQAALCSESGTITIVDPGHDDFPTGASIRGADSEGVRHQVQALSLKDFLHRYHLAKVSLLKLDCEGAEYDILYACEPATLEAVENIAAEVHGGQGDRENIEAFSSFLSQAGFACCVSTDRCFLWASRDPERLVQRTS